MSSNTYLDARKILQQFKAGDAPACLPKGSFKARHFGPNLDCEKLESLFERHGIILRGVEIVKFKGKADFVYILER